MNLILTEKPSVARAISEAIGGRVKKAEGYIENGSYIITWAVGHLVGLAEPHKYKDEWKSWRIEDLPMIPESLKLIIQSKTSKQFKIVKELMNSKDIKTIVFATDAGPQGELIARWIYQKANCKKPVQRLWISSITKEAILTGLKKLRPSEHYDNIYYAANSQARADWIVGLNATRAATLYLRQTNNNELGTFTAGRVQTPTLKKIMDREKEIEEFEPEDYFEVIAEFKDAVGSVYSAKWYDPVKKSSRIDDKMTADEIIREVTRKKADSVRVSEEKVIVERPLLHSLPMLEQQLSSKFNIKAAQVDEVAQELYDKGLITYPRTADNTVTEDVAKEFPDILDRLKGAYHQYLPIIAPNLATDKRYAGEVTDHHAIIPTGYTAKLEGLHAKIFDYIVKTFISIHHPNGIDISRQIETEVGTHLFITKDKIVSVPGWRKVWDVRSEIFNFEKIVNPVCVEKLQCIEETTKPPSRYTEASLIKEMERLKLGTPATRTGIIETLYHQKYIKPQKRSIVPTKKASVLIDHFKESKIASSEMTGEWETKLEKIRMGELDSKEFDQDINSFISETINRLFDNPKPTRENGTSGSKVKVIGVCPKCNTGQVIQKNTNNKTFYGCNRYPECRFFVAGIIGGTNITITDVERLLSKKETTFKQFEFNPGVICKAQLVMNKKGETSFNFKKKSLLGRITSIFK